MDKKVKQKLSKKRNKEVYLRKAKKERRIKRKRKRTHKLGKIRIIKCIRKIYIIFKQNLE